MKKLILQLFATLTALTAMTAEGPASPIAPPGVDGVDFSIGTVPLAKFRAFPERVTLNFDAPDFPETPGRIEFGGNAAVFEGFRRASQKGYFISAPSALLGTGQEKQTAASVTFERPVKAVGFVLQFATGTIRLRFLNTDGEELFQIEQNGQGDPSGNGTWADYFAAFENSNEFGQIKKIEFIRSNLNAGSVPEFAIDDLSLVAGAAPLTIRAPEPRTVDVALLGSTGAANVAPQRPVGNPVLTQPDHWFEFRNQVDGTDYFYSLDAATGLPSLVARTNNQAAIPVGNGWNVTIGGEAVQWVLKSARIEGAQALLAYEWKTAGKILPVTVALSLSGGSLVVEFSSEEAATGVSIALPKLTGVLKLSDSQNTAMRGSDAIPFLGFSGDLFFIAATRQFYSCYVDWTRSNSTAPYPAISCQSDAPLAETVVVTLADALPKVLPTIPNPTSAYREKIAGSVVVEFWYGSFAELAELFEECHRYGVDDLIVLMHRWQNGGFDRKYPSVMPPSPSRGGLETLRAAAAIARANGQTLALHENYKDFYPDSPEWDDADLLLNADGKPQRAWADSKEMAPSKIRKYAEPMMKRIHDEVGSNGCFLDVHSTHLPWWRVDFRPGVPGRGMMRGTLEPTNRLWQMARDIYGGPVFGEAYALTSWIHAGNIDSTMGQSSHDNGLILDFLLLKIRPLATNHGAGYFERWNPRGYIADWQNCPLPPEEYAKYSLQEVTYLTAPTIDDKIKRQVLPTATAYYQKRRMIRRLSPYAVTAITYYTADGRALTSSEAVLLPKAEIQRLHEDFADGSRLFANFSDAPWEIGGRMIAPLGFYASGGDFEAETNRIGGLWFDYYGGNDGYYLNSRNHDWMMEPKGTAAMGRGDGGGPVHANAGGVPVTRGPLTTDTAVALEREPSGAWRVRFVPQKQMGFVHIDLKKLGFVPGDVTALDGDGKPLAGSSDAVESGPGKITIRHRDPRVWSFRLNP